MTACSLPTLVALAIKAALFAYAIRSPVRNATSRLFLLLLGVLAAHDISGIAGSVRFARQGLDGVAQFYAYAWLVTVVFAAALLLCLALRFVDSLRGTRTRHAWLVFVPPTLLCLLMPDSDQVVAGFTPSPDRLVGAPGPWYFLFEAFLILYLASTVFHVANANRRADLSSLGGIRLRLWLLGLTPMVLFAIYLPASRHLALPPVSPTIPFPLVLSLLLLVIACATFQRRLVDIEFRVIRAEVINTNQNNEDLCRTVVPLAQTTPAFRHNLDGTDRDPGGRPEPVRDARRRRVCSLGRQIEDYERSLLTRSMDQAEGDCARAAAVLGMAEPTLRDKLAWYDIAVGPGPGSDVVEKQGHGRSDRPIDGSRTEGILQR